MWRSAIVLACIAIGALGAWLHWRLRLAPWHGDSAWDAILKPIGNLLTLGSLPGWLFVRALSPAGGDLGGAIVANTLSAALWVGVIFIALGLRRYLLVRHSEPASHVSNPARRAFVVNAVGAAGALAAGGVASGATLIEPLRLRVTKYRVPIADLPASLDGLRIGFLADLHLGPWVSASFIAEAVELARDLRADLYLLGGDYIAQSENYMEAVAALMRPLLEPGSQSMGVLGVLGNHDWWENGPRMTKALRDQGVMMIDNDRVFIDANSRTIHRDPAHLSGSALCIAALGDLITDATDIPRAFADIPADIPRILLTHEPDTAELYELACDSAAPRVDLMLCGHTHGGQVSLPLVGAPIVPSRYGQKYAAGLVSAPRFRVIISRGIGMSVAPVRWGVPPEVVEVTLTRA